MLHAMETTERNSSRLTRDERRAQTRERLLDAAADVFNRLGYHGASLEAVAEAAGYTKGAVYSNFASKSELFVALAERRGVSAGLEETTAAFLAMPIGDFVDGMGEILRAQAARDEAWDVLTIEVWLAAMRDPALRAVVADDYCQMREEFGPVIERKLAEEAIPTPFSGAELGTLVSALGTGLILQYYLDPAAVDPSLLARALRRLLGLPPRDRTPAAHTSA
jgi:AcrR family transcriptional regulator